MFELDGINVNTLIFYCCIFAWSFITLNLYEKNRDKKINKIFLFFSFFPLWFINVFRSNLVGADYMSVGNAYSQIVLGVYSRNYNWFWLPLRIFCRMIGFLFGYNPFYFYFILGTIFVFCLFKCILENSEYPKISLLLFIASGLYLQSFNQTRQMLALILVLFSVKYLKKNECIKYIICILFASVFHETALIFLPLYLCSKIKINSKVILYYIIFTALCIACNPIILKILSFTKYYIYFSSQYNISTMTSKVNLLIRILLLVYCLFYRDKLSSNKIYNYSLHMVMICTIIQVFTIKYYFLGRLTTYFYAFYIYLIPKCISYTAQNLSRNKKMLFYSIFYIGVVSLFLIYYCSQPGAIGSGYGDYSFIFGGLL